MAHGGFSSSCSEHRNMPQADAMVLVAKNYERYKSEVREKEREEIARRAAKMADETILQERERPLPAEEGLRGAHPPAMQALLNLLADNRYLTGEETDKIINYLRERKERQLRATAESLPGKPGQPDPPSAPQTAGWGEGSRDPEGCGAGLTLPASLLTASLPRQTMGATSGSLVPASQGHQSVQPLPASAAATGPSNPQQELQAKILSLFNSGASTAAVNVATGGGSGVGVSPNPGFSSGPSTASRTPQLGVAGVPQSQQRAPSQAAQFPNHPGSSRVSGPRPSAPPQPSQPLYQSRPPAPNNVAASRPAPSLGINFDNPSVQKALDTLIQSGPALSHLVSQTVGQARAVPPAQQALGSYQRHY